MGKIGIDDLEDLQGLRLGKDGQSELINSQSECTFIFNNEAGWPGGVIMTYLEVEGVFWVTAVEGRAHVRGVANDPRVSVVISNAGTGLAGRRMISVRGTAVVHRDAATKAWFLEKFANRHQPADPESFIRLLDSPKRVVIQVHPTAVAVTHDSTRMPGNGRGSNVESSESLN